jgi:hypothetical protein
LHHPCPFHHRQKGFRKISWAIQFCLLPFDLTSATAGPAVSLCFQIGRNKESFSVRRIDIIDLDGLYSLKEVLADDISDTFLIKNLVIFAWFIQNQAQRGPRSPTFIIDDPDGRVFLLIFKGLPDHLGGFLRNVKHRFPPVRNGLTRKL